MFVQSQTQFYLDHFLPRDNSWPAEGLGLEIGPYKAIVLPRRPEEDLFPDDIDRRLAESGMSLEPLSLPGGVLRLRVADRVVDRIGVIVSREGVVAPSDGRLLDPEVQREMEDTALFAVETVIASSPET